MRNRPIVMVVGVIFLVFLIVASVTTTTTANNPALQSAKTFLAAVETHDLEALERVSLPENVRIARAGSWLTGIRFVETSPFEGAFASLRSSIWTYTDLTNLEIGADVIPVVAGDLGIATVQTTNKSSIYLRLDETDNTWKVYSIVRPKPGT